MVSASPGRRGPPPDLRPNPAEERSPGKKRSQFRAPGKIESTPFAPDHRPRKQTENQQSPPIASSRREWSPRRAPAQDFPSRDAQGARLGKWQRNYCPTISPVLCDDNSIFGNAMLQQAGLHAGAESDHRVRPASRKIQQRRSPRSNGNAESDGDIRIHIHLPGHVTGAAYPSYQPANPSKPWRSRECQNNIWSWNPKRPPYRSRIEGGIGKELPCLALGERRRFDSDNKYRSAADEVFLGRLGILAESGGARRRNLGRCVIDRTADHPDIMARRGGSICEISQKLPYGRLIRAKELTDDDNPSASSQSHRSGCVLGSALSVSH